MHTWSGMFFPDHSYMQFFGDDFLRLLLLRFVFCYMVLILHKSFKVGEQWLVSILITAQNIQNRQKQCVMLSKVY